VFSTGIGKELQRSHQESQGLLGWSHVPVLIFFFRGFEVRHPSYPFQLKAQTLLKRQERPEISIYTGLSPMNAEREDQKAASKTSTVPWSEVTITEVIPTGKEKKTPANTFIRGYEHVCEPRWHLQSDWLSDCRWTSMNNESVR
jgi:hypothetical protein